LYENEDLYEDGDYEDMHQDQGDVSHVKIEHTRTHMADCTYIVFSPRDRTISIFSTTTIVKNRVIFCGHSPRGTYATRSSHDQGLRSSFSTVARSPSLFLSILCAKSYDCAFVAAFDYLNS